MGDEPGAGERIRGKLNSETARLPRKTLQRNFASGIRLYIDPELDLIEVGLRMHQDDAKAIEEGMNKGWIRPLSNEQARRWHKDDAELRACVLRPWVLLQAADEQDD
jgi:hypothetical protein